MKLTPKGMRDIPPQDMIIREEVVDKIRTVFRSFGYRPIDTPAMEYLKTLQAKAGAEVSKQIFVIDGGEYGLRFDLTVPLARYAAACDEPKPFKRYAIDNVWRREEPQRGRFRQFTQADVDIIGSSSMRCEAELLTLASKICKSFGFNKPTILLNNRKILDGVAQKIGVPSEKKAEVFRILDKLDKIGSDEVEKLLREILEDKTDEFLKIIKTKGSNAEKLKLASTYSEEGTKELEEILSLCDFEVEVDLFLVRGLGYYTGPVFEVKLSDDIGTCLAGGRYDELLGVYGQDNPAVGISVGLERLITLILEQTKEKQKTMTKLFVAAINPKFYGDVLAVAAKLREAGLSCETDLIGRNIRKQFDLVNSLSIKYMIIIGEKELESGKLTLRDMSSGEEEKLTIEEIIGKML